MFLGPHIVSIHCRKRIKRPLIARPLVDDSPKRLGAKFASITNAAIHSISSEPPSPHCLFESVYFVLLVRTGNLHVS